MPIEIIPLELSTGLVDHTQPFEGDQGIRFEEHTGDEPPEWKKREDQEFEEWEAKAKDAPPFGERKKRTRAS